MPKRKRTTKPRGFQLEPSEPSPVEQGAPLNAPPPPAPDPAAELAAAQQDMAEQFPDVPPPPPPKAEPGPDQGADAGEDVEDLAEELGQLDVAADLSEEEIADFFQLLFALIADKRGRHWELPDRSAARIGRWGHRVLERHPELLQWLAKNLPELVFGILLAVEVGQRYAEDRRLKKQPQEIVV